MRNNREIGLLDSILINIEEDDLIVISDVISDPNIKKFLADKELVDTAQAFFDNDLNLLQASRELILHRNTLIYRLEKIKKLLNLDIRKFSDAVTLQVIMVIKRTEIKRKRQNNKRAQLEALK